MSFPQGTEARVCQLIAERQKLGVKKYGTTVEQNPLVLKQWIRHALEETLDLAVYLQRSLEELEKQSPDDRTYDGPGIIGVPLPAVGKWHPIESAPKDGTPILAAWRGVLSYPPAFDCVRFRAPNWEASGEIVATPSFWAYLPQFPRVD